MKYGAELARSVREAPSILDFSGELVEVEDMIDLSFEGAQTSFGDANGNGVDMMGTAPDALDVSGTPTGTPIAASEKGRASSKVVSVVDKENILPALS
jgi:hypothetical protein